MKFATFFTGGIVPGTVRANKALVVDGNKALDTLNVVTLKTGAGSGVALSASALLINQAADDALRFVAAGSTKSLTVAANNKQVVKLDTITGSVVTLPAATGSGAKFRFLVTALATSNSHIVKVANASDTMSGIINGTRVDSGNAVLGFAAAASSDTITLNRTTTGSVSLGEWLEIEDVATNLWHVKGMLSATGAAFATPFSATV